MFTRIFMISALPIVLLSAGQADAYFNYSEDNQGRAIARMSPDIFQRLRTTGLGQTGGLKGTKGRWYTVVNTYKNGWWVLYRNALQVNGYARQGNRTVVVVTFGREPASYVWIPKSGGRAIPDLAGPWHSRFHRGAIVNLRRSGHGYVWSNFQGTSGTITNSGNTIRVVWRGQLNGSATATRITSREIHWSNGDVWYR